jgi:predicted RNA binding protein YcfA (HicA-like mRNA interferase family)
VARLYEYLEPAEEGGYIVMRHPDGRRTVVPHHEGRDIKRGLLRAIIRQGGLEIEDFLRL